MPQPQYPFVPKSNRYLVPGQYWAVRLSDGRYAAGRVIEIDKSSRVEFLIGLMDWVGPTPPTGDGLAGRKTLRQGSAHYLTIVDSGSPVLGHRPLELDGIEPDLMLNQAGWPGPWVQKGFTLLRPATREEWQTLPVFSGWGRLVIQVLAERVFVEGKPIVADHKTDLGARFPTH